MDKDPAFPDQHHIEQIRRRLWCGREVGQASVMIGSGFSRNAEPIAPPADRFPTWIDIARKLYQELYLPTVPTDHAYEARLAEATAGTGALRVASEYEAVFGRAKLNDLLLRSVPDGTYKPGHLHELLLHLPWADIFTTNYDTLLERTTPMVYERAYDLAVTASDLPTKLRPRIVKLHGGFPSYLPFIATEEDYRTYPAQFAPFVNTVQQAIMENVFVLIGFSGDDPNFQYWSGWVRDHLGPHHPPIYLAGILQISPSQRRLLESRSVIPLDLTPLFPLSSWPIPALRHQKAIEWFLLDLLYGETPSQLFWPIPPISAEQKWPRSPGVPPVPLGGQAKSVTSLNLQHLASLPLSAPAMRDFLMYLVVQREAYPGWVIAPATNRDSLWRDIWPWVEPALLSLDEISADLRLFVAYEINWCLETALVPIWPFVAEKLALLIEDFNPYPALLKLDSATIRPDRPADASLDWVRIGECWIELALAVTRAKREAGDEDGFNQYLELLRPVIDQRGDWQSRWHYERALMLRDSLDRRGAMQVLQQWPERPDLPFWEARRAAVLAEIGELRDARRTAETALSRIRAAIRPFRPDYALLSQEAWTMQLIQQVAANNPFANENLRAQEGGRWERLKSFRCDPGAEFDRLRAMLDQSQPVMNMGVRETPGFDPGVIHRTHRWTSGPDITPFLPAFALLRLTEEGAVPLRAGMVVAAGAVIENVAKWVAPFGYVRSVSILLRAGSWSGIDGLLDRVTVATIPPADVQILDRILVSALLEAIQQGNPDDNQLRILTEAISRLCSRLTVERLDIVLSLAITLYNHAMFREDPVVHQTLGDMFQRIFLSLPQAELVRRLSDLLDLPIPAEGGFTARTLGADSRWPEPFGRISWTDPRPDGLQMRRDAWTASVANLTRIVEHGIADARGRAAMRLYSLVEIGGLTDAELAAFRGALWSRRDSTSGLPAETTFLPRVIIALPPPTGDVKQIVREYLMSRDFPRIVERRKTEDGTVRKSVTMSSDVQVYLEQWRGVTSGPQWTHDENILRIDWEPTEVQQQLDKAEAWWHDEREELGSHFDEHVHRGFFALVVFLAEILLPKMGNASDDTRSRVAKLLHELDSAGIRTLRVLPLSLIINPSSVDEVTNRLRTAMLSSDAETTREAINGVVYWLLYSRALNITALPSPPSDLLDELISRVQARRQPELGTALRSLVLLLSRIPTLLDTSQIGAVAVGLEYLFAETALQDEGGRLEIASQSHPIPTSSLPEYRVLAARLARELAHVCGNIGLEAPPILERWREACRTDPLPEVRRAWPTDPAGHS
jgi:hypothetical protein